MGAQIGCILLDYVFAFTLLGAACVFALPFKKKLAGVAFGTVVVCLIRFLCSFLSGILLWGSYQSYYEWAANLPLWLYSLIYNGNYMLPETILTTVGALLIFRYLPRLFDRQ